jgi:hypothetical protein
MSAYCERIRNVLAIPDILLFQNFLVMEGNAFPLIFISQVFYVHHRLHPLSSDQWGAGVGELLHGAVQVSHLCPGLPHHQA